MQGKRFTARSVTPTLTGKRGTVTSNHSPQGSPRSDKRGTALFESPGKRETLRGGGLRGARLENLVEDFVVEANSSPQGNPRLEKRGTTHITEPTGKRATLISTAPGKRGTITADKAVTKTPSGSNASPRKAVPKDAVSPEVMTPTAPPSRKSGKRGTVGQQALYNSQKRGTVRSESESPERKAETTETRKRGTVLGEATKRGTVLGAHRKSRNFSEDEMEGTKREGAQSLGTKGFTKHGAQRSGRQSAVSSKIDMVDEEQEEATDAAESPLPKGPKQMRVSMTGKALKMGTSDVDDRRMKFLSMMGDMSKSRREEAGTGQLFGRASTTILEDDVYMLDLDLDLDDHDTDVNHDLRSSAVPTSHSEKRQEILKLVNEKESDKWKDKKPARTMASKNFERQVPQILYILENKSPEQWTKDDIQRVWRLLTSNTFFESLGTSSRQEVLQLLKKESFLAGQELYRQGDQPVSLYVVLSGHCGVFRVPADAPAHLPEKSEEYEETLGQVFAGESVGEGALSGFGATRLETVRAKSDVECLRLDREDYMQVASVDRLTATKREVVMSVLERAEPNHRSEAEILVLCDYMKAHVEVFKDVPQEDLEEVCQYMQVRQYRKGDFIIRQSTPADGSYTLLSGRVQVRRTQEGLKKKDDKDDKDKGKKQKRTGHVGFAVEEDEAEELEETIIDEMGEDETFGEWALAIPGGQRSACVLAISDCNLLFINASAYKKHLLEHRAATVLHDATMTVLSDDQRAVRNRHEVTLLDNFLNQKNLNFFVSLDSVSRRELCAKLKWVRFYPGDLLFKEGEQGDSFYVVLKGMLGIFRRKALNGVPNLASISDASEELLAQLEKNKKLTLQKRGAITRQNSAWRDLLGDALGSGDASPQLAADSEEDEDHDEDDDFVPSQLVSPLAAKKSIFVTEQQSGRAMSFGQAGTSVDTHFMSTNLSALSIRKRTFLKFLRVMLRMQAQNKSLKGAQWLHFVIKIVVHALRAKREAIQVQMRRSLADLARQRTDLQMPPAAGANAFQRAKIAVLCPPEVTRRMDNSWHSKAMEDSLLDHHHEQGDESWSSSAKFGGSSPVKLAAHALATRPAGKKFGKVDSASSDGHSSMHFGFASANRKTVQEKEAKAEEDGTRSEQWSRALCKANARTSFGLKHMLEKIKDARATVKVEGADAETEFVDVGNLGTCLKSVSEGEHIGEWALVLKSARAASALACSHVDALVVDKEAYEMMVGGQREDTVNNEIAIGILKWRGQVQITFDEVQVLESLIASNEFFKKFDYKTRTEISRVMQYQFLKTEETLFSEGEEADSFYMILKGSVGVYSKNVQSDQSDVELSAHGDIYMVSIREGGTIGEWSLVAQDQKRSATIRAETDTDLIKILKDDYNRIMKDLRSEFMRRDRAVDVLVGVELLDRTEEQLSWIMEYLKTVKYFNGNSEEMLLEICKNCSYKAVDKDQILVTQGDSSDFFYLILRGVFGVYVDPKAKTPKKGEVIVSQAGSDTEEIVSGRKLKNNAYKDAALALEASLTPEEQKAKQGTSNDIPRDQMSVKDLQKAYNKMVTQAMELQHFLTSNPLSFSAFDRMKLVHLHKEIKSIGSMLQEKKNARKNELVHKMQIGVRFVEEAKHTMDKGAKDSKELSESKNKKGAKGCKAELTDGDTVGELGIIRDERHFATVIAHTDAEVLVLDKDTFNNILRMSVEREMKQQINFLQKWLPGAEGVSPASMEKVATFFRTETRQRGACIVPAGQISQRLYLILSGCCVLVGSDRSAQAGGGAEVGLLEGGQFLGLTAVAQYIESKPELFRATVRSHIVNLLWIAKSDLKNLPSTILQGLHGLATSHAEWQDMRKSHLNAFALDDKEKYRQAYREVEKSQRPKIAESPFLKNKPVVSKGNIENICDRFRDWVPPEYKDPEVCRSPAFFEGVCIQIPKEGEAPTEATSDTRFRLYPVQDRDQYNSYLASSFCEPTKPESQSRSASPKSRADSPIAIGNSPTFRSDSPVAHGGNDESTFEFDLEVTAIDKLQESRCDTPQLKRPVSQMSTRPVSSMSTNWDQSRPASQMSDVSDVRCPRSNAVKALQSIRDRTGRNAMLPQSPRVFHARRGSAPNTSRPKEEGRMSPIPPRSLTPVPSGNNAGMASGKDSQRQRRLLI